MSLAWADAHVHDTTTPEFHVTVEEPTDALSDDMEGDDDVENTPADDTHEDGGPEAATVDEAPADDMHVDGGPETTTTEAATVNQAPTDDTANDNGSRASYLSVGPYIDPAYGVLLAVLSVWGMSVLIGPTKTNFCYVDVLLCIATIGAAVVLLTTWIADMFAWTVVLCASLSLLAVWTVLSAGRISMDAGVLDIDATLLLCVTAATLLAVPFLINTERFVGYTGEPLFWRLASVSASVALPVYGLLHNTEHSTVFFSITMTHVVGVFVLCCVGAAVMVCKIGIPTVFDRQTTFNLAMVFVSGVSLTLWASTTFDFSLLGPIFVYDLTTVLCAAAMCALAYVFPYIRRFFEGTTRHVYLEQALLVLFVLLAVIYMPPTGHADVATAISSIDSVVPLRTLAGDDNTTVEIFCMGHHAKTCIGQQPTGWNSCAAYASPADLAADWARNPKNVSVSGLVPLPPTCFHCNGGSGVCRADATAMEKWYGDESGMGAIVNVLSTCMALCPLLLLASAVASTLAGNTGIRRYTRGSGVFVAITWFAMMVNLCIAYEISWAVETAFNEGILQAPVMLFDGKLFAGYINGRTGAAPLSLMAIGATMNYVRGNVGGTTSLLYGSTVLTAILYANTGLMYLTVNFIVMCLVFGSTYIVTACCEVVFKLLLQPSDATTTYINRLRNTVLVHMYTAAYVMFACTQLSAAGRTDVKLHFGADAATPRAQMYWATLFPLALLLVSVPWYAVQYALGGV